MDLMQLFAKENFRFVLAAFIGWVVAAFFTGIISAYLEQACHINLL